MKQTVLTLTTLAVLATLSLPLLAQATAADMAAANQLVREKKWAAAETAYEEILREEPKNGRAWFFLGFARHSLGDFENAIAAFKKTIEISHTPAAVYNVAAGYARLGRKEEALKWLRMAVEQGAASGKAIDSDVDFQSIRIDARYKKIVEMAAQRSQPCKFSANARQFDFWLGDWDVFVNGRKVGENLVVLEINGCTLVENWRGARGTAGKSMNVYDTTTKVWKQFYVGSGGGLLELAGTFKEGIMRLEGETLGPKGKKIKHILEFHDLPDKTVRQWWRQSSDGGKTWKTVWDSIYKRKKPEKG